MSFSLMCTNAIASFYSMIVHFVNSAVLAVIIKYVQSVGAIMMNMTLSQAPNGIIPNGRDTNIYRNFNARYLKDGLFR